VRCSGRAGVGTEEAAASERASQGSTHVVGGEWVLQLGFVAGGVPEESQAVADAESPRAGAKRERDLCDIPASLLLPLLAAKRRSGQDSSSGMSHVRLPPAHGGGEREREPKLTGSGKRAHLRHARSGPWRPYLGPPRPDLASASSHGLHLAFLLLLHGASRGYPPPRPSHCKVSDTPVRCGDPPMAARRSASDRTTARARSFPVARVTTAADLRENLGKEAGGIRRRGGVELQLGFRVPCIYLVQP